MTNKEKAQEIRNKNVCCVYSDCPNVYSAAMKMAEWKERQMMDKACELLKDMACYYAHWEYNGDTYEKEVIYDTEKLIKDFKQAMEGGEQ